MSKCVQCLTEKEHGVRSVLGSFLCDDCRERLPSAYVNKVIQWALLYRPVHLGFVLKPKKEKIS